MSAPLKLLCVLAHPDDESLGTGGILAKYGAEGVETYVVSATRGERGWKGVPEIDPGLEGLGKLRTAELLAAAEVLGVRQVSFLDYVDGDLDQADPPEAIGRIVTQIRRIQPQVIVTFDPFGGYGHPDHIAICQFTTAAIMLAADGSYVDVETQPPHTVSKLYYMAENERTQALYMQAYGSLSMPVDGAARTLVPWPEWSVVTRPDVEAYWETVWCAVMCHHTQAPTYRPLQQFSETNHRELWGHVTYYRAFSLVNGGRAIETDLFEGLR